MTKKLMNVPPEYGRGAQPLVYYAVGYRATDSQGKIPGEFVGLLKGDRGNINFIGNPFRMDPAGTTPESLVELVGMLINVMVEDARPQTPFLSYEPPIETQSGPDIGEGKTCPVRGIITRTIFSLPQEYRGLFIEGVRRIKS